MLALLLACTAGAGVFFLCTAKSSARVARRPSSASLDQWLRHAGLGDLKRQQLLLFTLLAFIAGAGLGWMLFGGAIAPLLAGVFVASFPVTTMRSRVKRRRSEGSEAWPRMIEEIRLLCGSLGRPIPQALLEVGKRGPESMRQAFLDAEREWLITTDFERTVGVLKQHLADPTADATCETLLVAHNIGGADLDRRLAALAEDRYADLQGRKDAKAKQAGVNFARRFVLIVPVGMALAGLSIGNGRAAYASAGGQAGVAFGIIALAACWWWAGTLIRLPEERRVFND